MGVWIVSFDLADRLSQEGTLHTLSKSKPTMEFYPEARIDWLPPLIQQNEGEDKEKSSEA